MQESFTTIKLTLLTWSI